MLCGKKLKSGASENSKAKSEENGRLRRLRAAWRDTLLLVREFIRPLIYFTLAVIGGGEIYHLLARQFGEAVGSRSLVEAIYQVLGLTFLQPLGDNLPNNVILQLFYFIMPLIGISILAQGLADFGILFFNRRERSKEWEMAVASTFQDHIVIVGLGHLGYRIPHCTRQNNNPVLKDWHTIPHEN